MTQVDQGEALYGEPLDKAFESHPYNALLGTVKGTTFKAFNFQELDRERVSRMPFSIRVILESAVRNCDGFLVTQEDVRKILNWEEFRGPDVVQKSVEVPFIPARVLLQDFTGIPCMVDLAAMRDAITGLGGDPLRINPEVPVDLVIDHSVQVDKARSPDAAAVNVALEFSRNKERFAFLKWASRNFKRVVVIPPGAGIVHQVNLEYLARVVFTTKNICYPDSLVGTDSHTTMIDSLGVAGWGVGGIEAEAVMLGQPLTLVLPPVYGVKLINEMIPECTATDLVLHITRILRQKNVVDTFVEFFGEACSKLSVADRATIANMSPEYGATMGFFPSDQTTLDYLRCTGRSEEDLHRIQEYLTSQNLFRTYTKDQSTPVYTEIVEIDLSLIQPCVAGPKRPQDEVPLGRLKYDFQTSLASPVGFKGFGLSPGSESTEVEFVMNHQRYTLRQGSVVISAITSCTNTSNPSVMLCAGLIAKKAVEAGLSVAPYIKTSLSPGSGAVMRYLRDANLCGYLEALGFYLAGFGCMTCIGNSGDLPSEVADAINSNSNLVVASVVSGNRNFEGRIHPLTRANFLASPPLCVAFALAGKVDIDFQTEPLGFRKDGSDVFLRDLWPSRDEIVAVEQEFVLPSLFKETYADIKNGSDDWKDLQVPTCKSFQWDPNSTYIARPSFLEAIPKAPQPIQNIDRARCLVLLGDSVTTDHISPAGRIDPASPAGRFLQEKGVKPAQFNSYGSRRGNHLVSTRGTFGNIRLVNKLATRSGPFTKHIPSQEEMFIFDAAELYRNEKTPLVVIAGREYGSGSSRDWAAKGVALLGVRCVVAESYERIHRSNLVGMGVLPLQFSDGENAKVLGLTGEEALSIDLRGLDIKCLLPVVTDGGKRFNVRCRIETKVELEYFKHGGILNFVLRKLAGVL